MKQITSVLLLLAVLAATSLVSSCDEPDGRWDKMKWIDHSGLNQENGTYLVPADGGEYTFECKNYKAPWLSSIGVNGEYVYPNLASMDEIHSQESGSVSSATVLMSSSALTLLTNRPQPAISPLR